MDLNQSFTRLAFYQVLLGIVTFCFAEANPAMLLVAGSLVVLSRYITEGPWGKPLPWWVINLTALGTVAWLAAELLLTYQNIIIAMGHFTMWLQVLVLFARKSNREYGQLLMLSLLQMIGASVLSVSIVYGVLLAAYCVLALLTLLVFQLKSSSDRVYEANRLAAADRNRVGRPQPEFGRGYRWQFRAAAAAIGLVCALTAAVVFVIAPRSAELAMIGDSDAGLGPRQVGFSQQVKLDGPPIAQGSKEPVMNLRVELHGESIENRSWLMRGAVLDIYDPLSHTWKRSQEIASTDHNIHVGRRGLNLALLTDQIPMIHARVTLRQIGHRNLFTCLPMTYFQSDSLSSIIFSTKDQQLSSGGSVMGAVIYSFRWPLFNVADLNQQYQDLGLPHTMTQMQMAPPIHYDPDTYARGWPVERQRIAQYTRGILNELGLSRDPDAAYDPNDALIAAALADHLRETSSYTLESQATPPGSEPIIEFLFGQRRGHCELFASSLAAMTRSIGMQTRVVTGFRASEFNQIGGYYVIRQNDAHAWTEVNLGPRRGWHSYDATPADEIDRSARLSRTWLTVLREAYEHVEFGWIRSIVAYDVVTRRTLLTGLNTKLITAANDPNAWLGQVVTFVRLLPTAWRLDKTNTAKAIGALLLALLITVILIRMMLRRRRHLWALKLTAVPPARQRALVRQLAFFMDMTELLKRHGLVRPAWQSPKAFALDLAQAHPGHLDAAVTLTDYFYKVRFGHQSLDTSQRKRIHVHLRQLDRDLSQGARGRLKRV